MQELRSTDILDKEIQADARKKAERMLQKTDRECEQLLASVENDLEKDITDLIRAEINSVFKMHPRMHFGVIVHCITIDRQSHSKKPENTAFSGFSYALKQVVYP